MNYYNEHDPKAAAWLRELIKDGAIAPGEVDERSIVEVQPNELSRFTQCHFFAGIGGWSLALRLAGCPDDFPVWTGSCPCQPFSSAGKQLAEKDPRHLWPDFFRLIQECQPSTVFGEQVASKAGRLWLSGVFSDLENMGYATAGADLCAAGVGAPHIRQRLYWVALSQSFGWGTGSVLHQAPKEGNAWLGNGSSARGLADSSSVSGSEQWNESRSGIRRQSSAVYSPECTRPCGMADANGGNASAEREQRGREQRFQQASDGTCGLGNSAGNDQLGTRQHGSGKSIEIGGSSAGDSRRLAHPALPSGERLGQQRFDLPGQTAWSEFAVIPCKDGKSRRVEPGIFPLAHGVSGRVGLLRGYGNAIVPEVASEFIQAVRESIGAALI